LTSTALRVVVVGTGYVGLVTGACLAEFGHTVVCVDVDAGKVARLNEGDIPIYEPGISDLVDRNRRLGLLSFTTSIDAAVKAGADVLFIAVGTPDDGMGGADLSGVFAAVSEAAKALSKRDTDSFTVFVTKSTVPVGTSCRVEDAVAAHLRRTRFAVAANPEFLREGSAINDFMMPDRIVVGSRCERARRILSDLYAPLTRSGHPLVVTACVETAEMIKYAANAFLAAKVAFANELSSLCEQVGADVKELALGLGLDRRIGPAYLAPGPGFGGSCFPKDLKALAKTARDRGRPMKIVEAVISSNDNHQQLMVDKIENALGSSLVKRRIAVLGLSFKPDTDDMRDAPALTIVPRLIAGGAEVTAYDPASASAAAKLMPDLKLADSAASAVKGADAVVILTEWNEFRSLPWETLAGTMRTPLMLDLRNLYEREDMAQAGLDYVPIGRVGVEESLQVAAE
jgi:UDPglucose 6-dehydrogenase